LTGVSGEPATAHGELSKLAANCKRKRSSVNLYEQDNLLSSINKLRCIVPRLLGRQSRAEFDGEVGSFTWAWLTPTEATKTADGGQLYLMDAYCLQ